MQLNNTTPANKLLRAWRETLPGPEKHWPAELKRAVTYVHQHLFDETLAVHSLRKACYINGRNFSGKFSYYTGYTPKAYIQKRRIEAACCVLQKANSPNIPLVALAFSTGFSSHSAFTHAFKNQKGVAPSEFIDAIKKDGGE